MVYQNEHIPQIFYGKMQKVKIKALLQDSFWDSTLEWNNFYPRVNISSGHKRIDHYWSIVDKIYDESDFKKFVWLFSTVK